MEAKIKKTMMETILRREKLRKISKIERLIKSPFRTLPYYVLASFAKIKPFTIQFKTLWGDTLTSDLPNGNTFLYYGCAEANLTNFFLKNIKEAEIFIDGGANIGFYSLLVARLAERGQVHSFEPTPSTFQILEKNVGKIKNIKLNRLALLDKKTEIEFTDYGVGYNAFNSIHTRNGDIKEIQGRDKKIRVYTTTLDDYCKENAIIPTFIKLDLEGSEYFAIRGAERILREYKPTLSIEVAGDKEWIEYIGKTDEFLKNISYESFSIETDGTLKAHALEDSYRYDNLIYIHKENTGKYLK